MICAKCKQVLPDDSVFCQYCGTKIETEKNERNEHNMNYSDSEKILKEIFKLKLGRKTAIINQIMKTMLILELFLKNRFIRLLQRWLRERKNTWGGY